MDNCLEKGKTAMLGMEMMLSNMLGVTPGQLKDMSAKVINGIEAAGNDMADIRRKVDLIMAHLGVSENGGPNSSGGNGIGNSDGGNGGGGNATATGDFGNGHIQL
jgi:hypothetical protein